MLSVILPAYNEGALIGESLLRLRRHLEAGGGDWEIVVVDDGSTDGTARAVSEAAAGDPRIRLACMGANRGKGAALARGVSESRGKVIAVTDADLSYALRDLDAAVAAVRDGADLAAGTRIHPESRIALPFSLFPYLVRRWITGRLFRASVRLLYGLRSEDSQCGLKAFSRGAAQALYGRLRTRRYLADIEILLGAKATGMKVVRTPVHLSYLSPSSSVSFLGDLPGAIADLARIKLAQIRGHYRGGSPPST